MEQPVPNQSRLRYGGVIYIAVAHPAGTGCGDCVFFKNSFMDDAMCFKVPCTAQERTDGINSIYVPEDYYDK